MKHKRAAFSHQPNHPDLRHVFVELISDAGVLSSFVPWHLLIFNDPRQVLRIWLYLHGFKDLPVFKFPYGQGRDHQSESVSRALADRLLSPTVCPPCPGSLAPSSVFICLSKQQFVSMCSWQRPRNVTLQIKFTLTNRFLFSTPSQEREITLVVSLPRKPHGN